jgi:hypothetical protein
VFKTTAQTAALEATNATLKDGVSFGEIVVPAELFGSR